MPDPRTTINPETGRPIGEDLLPPLDGRPSEPFVETEPSELGADTLDEPITPSAREDGEMLLQNLTDFSDEALEEAAERMRKAFFG